MDQCTHEVRAELWFCTNNTKDVYKDMQANPEIEISFQAGVCMDPPARQGCV